MEEKSLIETLENLIKHYRLLLDLVRKEKNLLIAAQIEELNTSNQIKESMLNKVKSIDSQREKFAKALAHKYNLQESSVRLLEIAKKTDSKTSEMLISLHKTLEMLITEIQEQNQENEIYTQSALKVLNGALGNLKDTLQGKKTYARKGQMSQGPESAGNLVSREA